MKTKPANILRSGRFEQEKFDTDIRNLEAFYKKNGFIDVQIEPQKPRQTGDRSLELIIRITEGQKYTFGSIDVKGNESFTTEAILEYFSLQSGETFDQGKFETQLSKIYMKYFEEGFIYAEIEPDLQKDGSQLNIHLNISEGTRARVRQFTSQAISAPGKVLRRQLEIAPGDYYRQTQLIRTQQNIYNLGFFEPDIKLDYTTINSDGDIACR